MTNNTSSPNPDEPPPTDRSATSDAKTRLLYLSDAWLREASEAVAGLTPLESDLVVGVTVLGGPENDRSYHISLGTGPVSIRAGLDGALVTMTMKWPLAVAIAKGETSAQRSFLDGEIQLGGDASQLLGHQKQLAEVDDRLAKVRARTDYEI